MKKYGYPVLVALMALSVAVTGMVLTFLPDTVPVHFNFQGVADSFGSKYTYMMFPLIGTIGGVSFALAARSCGKKEDKENVLAEKILLAAGIFEVLLFTALGAGIACMAGRYQLGDAGPAVVGNGILKLVGVGTGLLLVVLGNFMPKAPRNSLFGLRTKWSMADDETWRKCQRFGGFSAVALGFFLLVTGVFMEPVPHLILTLAAMLLWAAAGIAVSYRFFKQAQ